MTSSQNQCFFFWVSRISNCSDSMNLKDRNYSKEYANAINVLEGSFTKDELRQLYSHKSVQHFYSAEKISQYLNRWTNQG